MTKLGLGHFWFKGLLMAGLLLSLLLFGQSVFNYYHVSRRLVMDQLSREAERQAVALERMLRRPAGAEPALLQDTLGDVLQDAQTKIAWIRVMDMTGKTLGQAGDVAVHALGSDSLRLALAGRQRNFRISDAPKGRVVISLHPLRALRSRPLSVNGSPQIVPVAAQRPNSSPRLMEIALYLDSANASFGPLRRNLIVSCLAAMGLVAMDPR